MAKTNPITASDEPVQDAPSPSPVPEPKLSLSDYLSREPRLINRPIMAGAFRRWCERRGAFSGPFSRFADLLTTYTRGAN